MIQDAHVKLNSAFFKAKAAFYRKTFLQITGLKCNEETSEMLRLEHNTVWCCNLVPEKGGEDQWNRLCKSDKYY
jgi:hypothetical protein